MNGQIPFGVADYFGMKHSIRKMIERLHRQTERGEPQMAATNF